MSDPYSILGIGRSATDDQIKQAYKDLIRKYHPDNYAGNPLEDLAADKTKEINEAYDQIMSSRRGGSSQNTSNGTYGNSYESNQQFQDIRRMIQQNRIVEAEEILDGMSSTSRTAEWYFLKGVIFSQRGWMEQAFNHVRTATQMDPSNQEYKAAYSRMTGQQNGNFQGNPYGGYNTSGNGGSGCDCCCQLMAMDCCCECMGGDLIPCC